MSRPGAKCTEKRETLVVAVPVGIVFRNQTQHIAVFCTKIVVTQSKQCSCIGEISVMEVMVVESVTVITRVITDQSPPTVIAGEKIRLFAGGVGQPVFHDVTQTRTTLLEQLRFAHFLRERHIERHLNQSLASPISVCAETALGRIVGEHLLHPPAIVGIRQAVHLFRCGKPRQHTAEAICRRKIAACCKTHPSARGRIGIIEESDIGRGIRLIVMGHKSLQHVGFRFSVKVLGIDMPCRGHHTATFVVLPPHSGLSRHDCRIARKKIGSRHVRQNGYGKIVRFALRESDGYIVAFNTEQCPVGCIHAIEVLPYSDSQTVGLCRKFQRHFALKQFSAAKIQQQIEILRFNPRERHSLRHCHIHPLVAVGQLHPQPPVTPIVGFRVGRTKPTSFDCQFRLVFHFASVTAPLVRTRYENTITFGFYNLRICPQYAGIGINQQVGPPVIGRHRIALTTLSHIDFARLHKTDLVSSVLVGLRFAQRRIFSIAATSHGNRLLPGKRSY